MFPLSRNGAIAAGTFDERRHTVRSVLVLRSIDMDLLRAIAREGEHFGAARIAAPLVMTTEYIQASLDAFPLELIEVRQQHITILGEELFDQIEPEDRHLRLQCERELKTVLIALRQGLLASAGHEKLLGRLEVDAVESVVRTLRGLLWLKGRKETQRAAQVIACVEEIAARPLRGIREALDVGGAHGWEQFKDLYADVETLGQLIDGW